MPNCEGAAALATTTAPPATVPAFGPPYFTVRHREMRHLAATAQGGRPRLIMQIGEAVVTFLSRFTAPAYRRTIFGRL